MVTKRLRMPNQINQSFVFYFNSFCEQLLEQGKIVQSFNMCHRCRNIVQQFNLLDNNTLNSIKVLSQFYQLSIIEMSQSAKKQIVTPLKKEASIVSLNQSSILSEHRHKSHHQIQMLVQKFNEVNDQIQIESDLTNFNLISYEKEDEKIKYDPQMMAAKLRKLENRAQINRAQREIENRQKKRHKKFSNHKSNQLAQNYQTIYKKFLHNSKLTSEYEQISDDESTENKNNPKGVAYITQLRRHPLLLEYTISKMDEKQKGNKQRAKRLQTNLLNFKQQSSKLNGQYKEMLQQQQKKIQKLGNHNPQTIIETRFSKFYTKKSTDKLSNEVKNMPRCSRMIEKQNSILSEIEQKSLSKENKQKLKSRLNQIILNISKSQKLNSFTLPKLHYTHRQQQLTKE